MDKSVETVENPAGILTATKSHSFSRVIGVFAKAPIPGQVKTRLCPPLSPGEAAELYAVSQAETLNRLQGGRHDLVLFFSGDEDYFSTHYPDLRRLPQSGDDLGERMCAALQVLLAEGYSAAALVGTDSPDLPISLVSQAFEALADLDALWVPAVDGGYVLIGCSRPCPELFSAVPWSSPDVLRVTRERAIAAGLSYRELGRWEDIDDQPALKRLLERSPDSATANYLRREVADRLGW